MKKTKEKQTFIFETVATGFWTRSWYVKATSQKEALKKLNGNDFDPSDEEIEYHDDLDNVECTSESGFDFWGIQEDHQSLNTK
jgi:hypothetical protein